MPEKTTPKLALVAGTRLSPELGDYALKVAVRLDLDIVVLFTGEDKKGPKVSLKKLERVVEAEAAAFSARAWRKSVQVTTVVDAADQKTALQNLQKNNPDICFVLADAASGNDTPDDTHARHRLTVIRT